MCVVMLFVAVVICCFLPNNLRVHLWLFFKYQVDFRQKKSIYSIYLKTVYVKLLVFLSVTAEVFIHLKKTSKAARTR